jgi:hypothetical protein
MNAIFAIISSFADCRFLPSVDRLMDVMFATCRWSVYWTEKIFVDKTAPEHSEIFIE